MYYIYSRAVHDAFSALAESLMWAFSWTSLKRDLFIMVTSVDLYRFMPLLVILVTDEVDLDIYFNVFPVLNENWTAHFLLSQAWGGWGGIKGNIRQRLLHCQSVCQCQGWH